MEELEGSEFKSFRTCLRLHDALIRLVELRLEEVERRVFLLSREATT